LPPYSNYLLRTDYQVTKTVYTALLIIKTFNQVVLDTICDRANILLLGDFKIDLSEADLEVRQTAAPPKIITVRHCRLINIADVRKDLEFVPWHIMDIFDDDGLVLEPSL